MRKIYFLIPAFIFVLSATVFGQTISLTSGTYTQDFNTLSNTAASTTNNLTIPGWFMTESGGGARDNEQYAVDPGSSNTGDTYSYGTAGSTDRALGQLRSGTLISIFGAGFTNNSGSTITSLTISYTGEQWRLGAITRTDQIDFQYSTNATSITTGTWADANSLDFVSPFTTTAGALDGNAAANRAALTLTITGLNIANGATFFIRWTDVDATGADDGLAVDDFSLSFSGTPTTTVSVAAGVNAAEPSTNGTFTVALSSPAPVGGITVTYTLSGSASNTDYSDALAGSITIAEGNSNGTITLAPNDDPNFEGTETIDITLNTATSPYTINTGTASINLIDNDAPPSVSVAAGITAAEPATNGTFTINLSSPAPAGGVTVNYTLTGSATLNTDYSDPLSGVISIAQGQSSGTVTINASDDIDIEGAETITITLNSATNSYVVGAPASASINLLDNDNPPIVINEVYGGGGNGGSLYKNDFIELYNNGNVPYSLAGWSIQYNSSAGTGPWQTTSLSGSIPPHGYYLIQEAAGAGGTANLPTPDASGSIAMAAGAGKVALVNNTVALTGQNPLNISIVDKVAYGSVTGGGFEGAGSAPVPSATNSIQRTPTGFDSNNNSTDFTSITPPTPKNSVTDVTPPAISTLSPANTAINTPAAFTAVLTFNENVEKQTGNIVLKKTADNSIVKTYNVASTDVTVGGASVSFLVQGLAYNTSYYLEVDNGAFRDLSENVFTGFAGNSTWSFTTGNQPVGIVGNNYSFNTCTSALSDGFSFYSAVGPQIWGCTTFGRNAADLPLGSAPNGVQINGFSGTNIPNIDWLISPSFNLTATTYPLLSFWSRTAFNGKPLLLKISTDYNGGDPAAATWTDLNGKFPGQTSNAWTLSENINLSAFKQSNVHFAYVYTSTDDDGARWTLDDITVINSPVPPPPSLTVSTTDVQFTYVAAGSTADKTFTFIGNDLTDNVTLNATGDFLLSKDGIAFSTSLLYTPAEASDVTKTVTLRFSPTQNNLDFSGSITVATSSLSEAINLKGTSIDPITTLEVVNWNIEWFGSTTFGPTNENLQEQNIKTILQNLNADVYALAEVVSETRLANVVSQMPGYSYVISNYGSHTNPFSSTPSPLGEAQKLAFVYKTALFSNVTTTPLLSAGINTAADIANPAYNYWSSGRFPFMMSADVTLNCVTKNVKFILVHAKANTAPTAGSYTRRKNGADTLHYTLQQNYANDNIIMLGDYNDDLDQSITDGFTTTSWNSFTNDTENFEPVTLPLSLAGKKSTVSYNDVIDHVTISNDFEPYYLNATASILTDVTSLVSNYGSTTTDHYPVFTRYRFSNSTAPAVTSCTTDVTFCASTTNTYSIPVFAATDDCGDVVTYNYVITGATTRNGSSNDASGSFNIGTSVITWTAMDSWGNSSTCQTTVIINDNPTVTIPDAFALSSGTLPNTVYIGYAPASSLTLNAQASGGTAGYTYNWSTGSINTSITVNPTVTTAYSVTVTDNNGCQATANKTVTVVDIRGGKKLEKVVICHKTPPGQFTLVVGQTDVPIHLAHGDMLGSCAVDAHSITRNANSEEYTTGKLALQVLPNPSASYFTITMQAKTDEKIRMKVTDALGRMIEQKQNLSANQSLTIGNNYTAGLYFVEITQGLEKVTLKLVKL
ncbi:MAG TPA: choice-of-anchor J domain-containing protein [Chitinophagaceae bacterium]